MFVNKRRMVMKLDRKGGEGILFLTDEDLELIDIDPKKVDDSDWSDILDYLRDHYNDTFAEALIEAAEYVLARANKEKVGE
jgi:hypothetical protein